MPIARRKELLGWALKEKDRYIIEDDHDSEFRYKGLPIPPMKAIDTQDKVIYLGTFSRTIAPAIRIGFMIHYYDIWKSLFNDNDTLPLSQKWDLFSIWYDEIKNIPQFIPDINDNTLKERYNSYI